MKVGDLYQKIHEFEDSISQEVKSLSQCQKGCSRCCYVDLSVFQVEADNIRNWFQGLSEEEKSELRIRWTRPLNQTENFHGETVKSCIFLHDEACTIYEARPLICRTQGLAFKFHDGQDFYLDICPLNEEELQVINQKEILNLDLINRILSELEKNASQSSLRERVELTKLRQEFSL